MTTPKVALRQSGRGAQCGESRRWRLRAASQSLNTQRKTLEQWPSTCDGVLSADHGGRVAASYLTNLAGPNLQPYSYLKRTAPSPNWSNVLAALPDWARPPHVLLNARKFRNTFPETRAEILGALPEPLRCVDGGTHRIIQSSNVDAAATAEFIHAPAVADQTHVLNRLVHVWIRHADRLTMLWR